MKKKFYRIFYNYEKEETWLNKMASEGFNLSKYNNGFYTFEKGNPHEFIYRIQLLDKLPTNPNSVDYLNFLQESGIEVISQNLRWIYLRKKSAEGPFKLFTDRSSIIAHYQKSTFLRLPLALAIFVSGVLRPGAPLYLNIISIISITLLIVPAFSYQRNIRRLKQEAKIIE